MQSLYKNVLVLKEVLQEHKIGNAAFVVDTGTR
jgi:hypothetical protein